MMLLEGVKESSSEEVGSLWLQSVVSLVGLAEIVIDLDAFLWFRHRACFQLQNALSSV